MRKFFGLTAVALMMAALMFSNKPAQANTPSTVLASILDRMSTAGSQLRTLKANLSQQKRNTQIGINGPVEAGTLYYRPLQGGKSQLRIDYTSPEVKTLVVDGDKFTLYQPNLNQLLRSSIQNYAKSNSAGTLSLRFDDSQKAKFNISYVRDETVDGVKTSVLALIPKPGVQAPFKRQELWVNHQTWLPIKVELTEKNNDVTWIRFGNMQQNISLNNNFFSVKPQPGTKVING